MRFLVTAGNTRERIDEVREWGNIFTGGTGLAIATALAAELGPVDLLTSNAQHVEMIRDGRLATAHPIVPTPFRSHAELKGLLAGLVPRTPYDAVVMTAAVADYRPARVYAIVDRAYDDEEDGVEHWVVRDAQAAKVKSDHEAIAVLGVRTEKLIDLFRKEWGYRGILVKFKLEVGLAAERLLEVAEASRKASGADYLVANTLDMVDGEGAGAYILSDSGRAFVERGKLAGRLVEILREKR